MMHLRAKPRPDGGRRKRKRHQQRHQQHGRTARPKGAPNDDEADMGAVADWRRQGLIPANGDAHFDGRCNRRTLAECA